VKDLDLQKISQETDIGFMRATLFSIEKLHERIKSLEAEIKVIDNLNDMALSKLEDADKMLFTFIVHLAKNGEIRTLLVDTLANNNKEKPLTTVIAFDGDEAGQLALNRFAADHLCGDPKKFKIGANFDAKLTELDNCIKGFIKKYYEDKSHTDKKTNKYKRYI